MLYTLLGTLLHTHTQTNSTVSNSVEVVAVPHAGN